MTQASTYTSWAMEELLEPWVHYVPLNEDLSDVEEKMQWVLDNDESAKEIAHRGKLWMSDLIFHPNAQRDDDLIFEETFKRYRKQFSMNKQLTI
jgi:Glycosyl transferase family 90